MPAAINHIIRRQYYEIKVASQQQGRSMQQQLQQLNAQYLVPALTDRLNEWFNQPDEIVTIDAIHIDIGRISPLATPAEWLEKILHQLEQQLKPVIEKKPPVKLPAIQQDFPAEPKIIKTEETAAHAIAVFIYFLHNGLLPAACMYASVAELFSALRQMNATSLETLKHRLAVESSPFFIQRLALLSPENSYFITQLFVPELSLAGWQAWMNHLLSVATENATVAASAAVSISSGSASQYHPAMVQLFQYLLQAASRQQSINWAAATQAAEQAAKNQAAIAIKEKPASDKVPIQNRPETPDEALILAEGIFITHAGICLASAYLGLFFKALAYTDGAVFLSVHLQQRAICLLHFLSSGQQDFPEEKLVLAKLLCGWPLQMPLTKKIILTEAECTEATELLQSLIEHWKTLKNTSPMGLQEAFLQRSGKLSDKDDHFLLQVEHQSIDILLESVPWQFRFIKLPWMKKRIVVEWY